MSGMIDALLDAPADQRLFRRGDGWISAGEVRDMAARAALPTGADAIYLHTTSAAHFLAGLLAAAAEDRTIALPAHTHPATPMQPRSADDSSDAIRRWSRCSRSSARSRQRERT